MAALLHLYVDDKICNAILGFWPSGSLPPIKEHTSSGKDRFYVARLMVKESILILTIEARGRNEFHRPGYKKKRSMHVV